MRDIWEEMTTIKLSKLQINKGQIEGLPKNPRFIKDERFEKLCANLEKYPKFLEQRPIVIKSWSEPVILGGNMRFQGLKHLGYKEVPQSWIKTADEFTEEELKAFVIIDNVPFGENDWDLLANEWDVEDLADWGLDVPNFETVEVQEEDESSVAETISKAKELQEKWQTSPNQLWSLGSHRLLCGDNSKRESFEILMGGETAVLCVTSPPYNQNLETFKPSGMQKESPNFVNRMASAYFDSLPEEEYQSQQVAMVNLIGDFLSENGSLFYNHKIRYRDKKIVSPYEWLSVTNLDIRQEIIWNRKSSITMNARMFFPVDERIYWLKKGDDFIFNDELEIKNYTSVWEFAAKNDVQVTAAFATELPLRCVKACSRVSDLVIEPYSGSGTTLIACEQLNRKCYAIEISAEYCAVILERWHILTGKTPELIDE